MKVVVRFGFLVVAFLLPLALLLAAQTRQGGQGNRLRGVVVDEANEPLADAFVLVHSSYGKGDVTVKLDEHGGFELPLTPGVYDVFIAAGAFVPQCKVVEIADDHATTFKATMKPDRKHLQQDSR